MKTAFPLFTSSGVWTKQPPALRLVILPLWTQAGVSPQSTSMVITMRGCLRRSSDDDEGDFFFIPLLPGGPHREYNSLMRYKGLIRLSPHGAGRQRKQVGRQKEEGRADVASVACRSYAKSRLN